MVWIRYSFFCTTFHMKGTLLEFCYCQTFCAACFRVALLCGMIWRSKHPSCMAAWSKLIFFVEFLRHLCVNSRYVLPCVVLAVYNSFECFIYNTEWLSKFKYYTWGSPCHPTKVRSKCYVYSSDRKYIICQMVLSCTTIAGVSPHAENCMYKKNWNEIFYINSTIFMDSS